MYLITIKDLESNRFNYPERIRKSLITRLRRYGYIGWSGSCGFARALEHGECVRSDIEHLLLGGPVTSQELADRLRMSKRCVLRQLARLQREGRVVRFVPEDERRAWFRLANKRRSEE